jgi:HSP20 family protein
MALVKFTRRHARPFAPYTAPVFSGFDDIDSRMSRFIDRALTTPFDNMLAEPIGWLPAMDISESAGEVVLTAELPGMDLKDIDVTLENGLLTIRGEKIEERNEGEEKKFHLYERTFGSFERSFVLPTTADGSKVSAKFREGVLKVHVPKAVSAKAAGRKIEIKAGA